jgi:2-hydroxy-3-oxopropionate reductase
VFDAIKDGLAGSAIMNAKIPAILDGSFKPGFRLELHIMEIMQALRFDGMAASDHSAIIKFYEKLAKV